MSQDSVLQWSVSRQIDFFLTDPTVKSTDHRGPQGEQSTLFLLRREAQLCLIGDVVSEERVLRRRGRHRLFASLMVLFSGIDLLGKFTSGEDGPGVRKRFVDLARDYMSLNEAEADALWTARNTVMHAFGLYDPPYHPRPSRRMAITLSCDQSGTRGRAVTWQVIQGEERWILCVEHFYQEFVDAIRAYKSALEQNQNSLQSKFARMFENYGYMLVEVIEAPFHKPKNSLRYGRDGAWPKLSLDSPSIDDLKR